MIKNENTSEEVVIKVNDRRKFNLDGTLREGVVIERKEEEKKSIDAEEKLRSAESEKKQEQTGSQKNDENSSMFISFLSTIAGNIAGVLGVTPHPITGQKMVDLEAGRYWIDVLAMLKEKTKGNLSAEEESFLNEILAETRMQYVQMVRLTEERLKAQAAKKFSAKDILGKR
ncbi:MAG: DUF1844 domain-containing protein [Acidobacteria bacterium]|jgi:hypothetical protein|nr:MAG: DUF1844 domain-containing protein [Acidobacteriota bacterium]GIU83107.1 MAG: hypothetical protein KatS3mg006_2171 [Pyrinomonadaceae bacterium]